MKDRRGCRCDHDSSGASQSERTWVEPQAEPLDKDRSWKKADGHCKNEWAHDATESSESNAQRENSSRKVLSIVAPRTYVRECRGQ